MSSAVLSEFKSRIASFVSAYLSNYELHPDKDKPSVRIIHDPVWGSNQFHSWEMAIIDSPLLQRLRMIKQVGFGHYVYPTARHSRFDHTLGMVSVVSRIARGLNTEGTLEKRHTRISPEKELMLRMAAVLHDVGHCLLSHVGERLYSKRNEFQVARQALIDEFGVAPKPHEVMSYYIIMSKPFVKFYNQVLADKRVSDPILRQHLILDHIARAIIGCWSKGLLNERYQVEIINGPLDADKLDYLARDAQFAGLSVVYDFNRYMVTIITEIEKHRLLTDTQLEPESVSVSLRLPMKGATSLEQILISKMMLFSYLYHQQKVVAAESMLLECFDDFTSGGTLGFGGRNLDHAVDLLYLTDESLEQLLHPESTIGTPSNDTTQSTGSRVHLRNLASRRLVKRALVISRLFIEGLESQDPGAREAATRGFVELERCLRDADQRKAFRARLYEKALTHITKANSRHLFDEAAILIAWPSLPDVSEAEHMVVPFDATDADARSTALTKLFPLREWAYSYSATQWKGYIFCPPGYREAVQKAAKEIIEAEFRISLSSEAILLSGVPPHDNSLTPQSTPPPPPPQMSLFDDN